jgi:hypothetical protein
VTEPERERVREATLSVCEREDADDDEEVVLYFFGANLGP